MEKQLDFENQIFVELLSEDGLIILARGLGLDRLFLKFLKLYSDPHNLVLVLNATPTEERYYVESLTTEDVVQLPKTINNEVNAKERETLYLQGGVLFITSRILVVDLLRKQCPVENVAGILVLNAHKITDSSTEAFILRLYRQDNKIGFIKAFSDAPEPFTNGFCQLERVMRNLFLRHVYLWSRFHATVSATLSRHKPDVIELRQQMTPTMTAIQMSVLDIMKACVTELKRCNTSLDIDEMSVENSMSKSFDQVIKMLLDPIWNQLGSKTKQLIFDLRLLRTLLHYLTQYDCVTFFSYLESVRSSNESRAFTSHSSWAFMDATNMLFVKARERVYGCGVPEPHQDKEGSKKESKSKQKQDSLFEESPKWHLLTMVLDEIRKESKSNTSMDDRGRILVIANDERTCYQLREYLCHGGQQLLQRQFDRLLSQKSLTEAAAVSSRGKAAMYQRGRPQKRGSTSTTTTRPAKKRKVATESADKSDKTEVEGEGSKNQEDVDKLSEKLLEELENIEMVFESDRRTRGRGGGGGGRMRAVPRGREFGVLDDPVVVLHALNSSENIYHFTKVLQELQPRYIVMYDAEVQFVRQVEVFKACNPGMPLRVYFLLYDSSVEEQKYLTSLRKEKEAFQQLIKERAHMVVPVDREGKVVDSTLLRRDTPSSSSSYASDPSISTRKAGGRQQDQGPQTVLIDMREFRSTLPSLLHKRGIELNPLTLEVGDYILSPDICVERKSVSDLIGSLNSGRLYNQATAMTRHYKRPMLLIEFDENKSFSLQSASAIQSDISNQSVSSKLVLLTLHFPNLRVLWCSSPYATAEVFETLKKGQPQPDADVAMAIGQDSLDKVEGIEYSATVQDFLLKLPGVNSKNFRSIMNQVADLQELVSLSQNELEKMLCNDANAKLLWNFLHSELEVSVSRGKKNTKK